MAKTPRYPAILRNLLDWLRPRAMVLACTTLGITGLVYFSPQLVYSQTLASPASTSHIVQPKPAAIPKPLPRSLPTRLIIPKLNIDTAVVALGLKASGSMYTPAVPEQTGWYKYSPTPGELGPSIIVGHVDSPKGPAIFWRLHELQPGDVVVITRADGTNATFKVDSIKDFPQSDFPTAEIYGNINYAGIRLITCGGVFNTITRHYSNNTVVFGTLTD